MKRRFMNSRPSAIGAAFLADRRGATAVEFAVVALPFLFLITGVIQMGLFYMSQSALDSGVLSTAQILRNSFASTVPVFPGAAVLKQDVATLSGGLIQNGTSLAVEIRQISNLQTSLTPIADGTVDYGSSTSVLVLRAQARVPLFTPGFSATVYVVSTAIVRRQGS
jgi:Flp pilus assembly protein TadG